MLQQLQNLTSKDNTWLSDLSTGRIFFFSENRSLNRHNVSFAESQVEEKRVDFQVFCHQIFSAHDILQFLCFYWISVHTTAAKHFLSVQASINVYLTSFGELNSSLNCFFTRMSQLCISLAACNCVSYDVTKPSR